MVKIKETKRWWDEDVWQLCVSHDYYTRGDNKSYNDMLHYVKVHEKNPTLKNIYYVAKNIKDHSDQQIIEDEPIESIMFNLSNLTIKRFYEIEEG